MAEYKDLPISELAPSARRVLSLHLNPLTNIPGPDGIPNDIRGVAELRGFCQLMLDNFMITSDPTDAMLREWNSDGLHLQGSSVQTLLDILQTLDRRELLEALQPGLQTSLMNYNRYRNWQESLGQQETQVAEVSSASAVVEPPDGFLSIHDTVEVKRYFDVFVSCTGHGKDLEFTRFVVDKLEREYGITCFLPVRDGLAAGSTHTIHASLIKERCRKFLLLISREYQRSPECQFQVRFAQYLSPGAHARRIIPIVIEEGASKPDIIKPITGLDWTRKDLRCYFWDRLVRTIKVSVPYRSGADRPEMDSLSLVSTDSGSYVHDPAAQPKK